MNGMKIGLNVNGFFELLITKTSTFESISFAGIVRSASVWWDT